MHNHQISASDMSMLHWLNVSAVTGPRRLRNEVKTRKCGAVEHYVLTTKTTENETNRSSSTSQLMFVFGLVDLSATQSNILDH